MNFYFFLGGHDAEMLEIKKILLNKKVLFYDKKLKWGAKISDYNEELDSLNRETTPVFVELKLDRFYPQNSVIIDHHGPRSGKDQKTSIEQVAELLNVKLTRHQQLISINDKSHIRGMKEWGATDSEIIEIRSIDRKAQGVTEKDEFLAEKSIKENLEIIGENAAIIISKAEKTSAVIDRIHDHFLHTIVFSPDGNMHYFGPGYMLKHIIKQLEKQKIVEPKIEYWYGGALPDFGFLGTTKSFSKQEVKKVLSLK